MHFSCNWLLQSAEEGTPGFYFLQLVPKLHNRTCSYCSYRQKAHLALKFVNSVACTIIPVSSVHYKCEVARNNFMNYSNICAASSLTRARALRSLFIKVHAKYSWHWLPHFVFSWLKECDSLVGIGKELWQILFPSIKRSRSALHLLSYLVKLSTRNLAAWVLHHIRFFLDLCAGKNYLHHFQGKLADFYILFPNYRTANLLCQLCCIHNLFSSFPHFQHVLLYLSTKQKDFFLDWFTFWGKLLANISFF